MLFYVSLLIDAHFTVRTCVRLNCFADVSFFRSFSGGGTFRYRKCIVYKNLKKTLIIVVSFVGGDIKKTAPGWIYSIRCGYFNRKLVRVFISFPIHRTDWSTISSKTARLFEYASAVRRVRLTLDWCRYILRCSIGNSLQSTQKMSCKGVCREKRVDAIKQIYDCSTIFRSIYLQNNISYIGSTNLHYNEKYRRVFELFLFILASMMLQVFIIKDRLIQDEHLFTLQDVNVGITSALQPMSIKSKKKRLYVFNKSDSEMFSKFLLLR